MGSSRTAKFCGLGLGLEVALALKAFVLEAVMTEHELFCKSVRFQDFCRRLQVAATIYLL